MNDQTISGISRRTLAKGAAWSVPAVAVAAAAPAYAQSVPEECIGVAYTGNACKEPGNSTPSAPKAYNLGFTFTNTCTTGCVTVVVTRVYKPNGSDENLYLDFNPLTNPYTPSAPSNTFEVCAGTPVTFNLPTTYSSNSANGIQVNYTVNGVADTQFLDSPPACPPIDGGRVMPAAETVGADQVAADQAAVDQAATDQAAADQAAVDQAAVDQAPVDQAAMDQAAAEKIAADQATASPSPSPTPES